MDFEAVFELAEENLGSRKAVASALSMDESEYSKKRSGTIGMKPPEITTLLSVAGLTITDSKTVTTYMSMIEILMREKNQRR